MSGAKSSCLSMNVPDVCPNAALRNATDFRRWSVHLYPNDDCYSFMTTALMVVVLQSNGDSIVGSGTEQIP